MSYYIHLIVSGQWKLQRPFLDSHVSCVSAASYAYIATANTQVDVMRIRDARETLSKSYHLYKVVYTRFYTR